MHPFNSFTRIPTGLPKHPSCDDIAAIADRRVVDPRPQHRHHPTPTSKWGLFRLTVPAVLYSFFAAGPSQAAQVRSCEELRDEIASRASWPKGSYSLAIVSKDEAGGAEKIGTCEGGERIIVVHFGRAAEPSSPSDADGAKLHDAALVSAPAVSPGLEVKSAPQPAKFASEPSLAHGAAPAVEEEARPSDLPDTEASATPRKPTETHASTPDQETLSQYKQWIAEAHKEHPYPESEERMFAVMECESSGKAAIVSHNGADYGLFQYSHATWNGEWNRYRDQDILDPRAQIFATALAWQLEMQSSWGCYKNTQ